MSEDDELLKIITIATRLLCMQIRPRIEGLKTQLLKTSQQGKAYDALDGKRSIEEIAHFAGYSNTRTLETMLPDWERQGFILSTGKGAGKKYLNIDNLGV